MTVICHGEAVPFGGRKPYDGLKGGTRVKIVVGIVLWLIIAFAGAMLFGCVARYGNGEPFDFWHGWRKPPD